MTDIGKLVEIRRIGAELSVEWQVQDVLSLPGGSDVWYLSQDFSIADERWRLRLYPNWNKETRHPTSDWMRLGLVKYSIGPPKTFHFTVGIRGSNGVEKSIEGEKEFWGHDEYTWNDFCSRSELVERKTRLMTDGVLNIKCVLKGLSTPGAGVWSLRRPSFEVTPTNRSQSTDNQGFDGRNVEDIGRRGARGFRSCSLGGLGGSDGPNARVFGESNGESLERPGVRGIECCDGQGLGESYSRGFCGNNAKSVGGHVARGFAEGITDGLGGVARGFDEGIKDGLGGVARGGIRWCIGEGLGGSDVEGFGEGNEGSLGASGAEGGIRWCIGEGLGGPDVGDNDLHKKEVEYLMEEIKILQKAVEKYKLESAKYKKQMEALESETLSIAEKHKCQSEEKSTIVSRLEKVNKQLKKEMESLKEQNKDLKRKCEEQTHNLSKTSSELRKAAFDDDTEEVNNGNNNDENIEESKNERNLKQLNQAKKTKKSE